MHKLKAEKEVIGIYLSGHPLDPYKLEIERLTTHQLSELMDIKSLANKEIKFAGVVSSVNHRVSQKGNPFGSFVLEDFSGTNEMTLFGNDYLNFRKYLELGYFLYIKARIQNRWGKDDDFEIKINSIEMLPDIREKYIKYLAIDLSVNDLNADILQFIQEQVKSNTGNALLSFRITDTSDAMAVNMVSSKFKISLSNDLLKSLDDFGLNYKLN
jgi:DNA polymerase-3 subunit alpha